MEVKVSFEDFDLEAEVEKAVIDKIRSIAGNKVYELLKDNNIDYVTLTERIDKQVRVSVNNMINSHSDTIEKLIERKISETIDKEIDGIIRKKVAKIMSPYIEILKEVKNG